MILALFCTAVGIMWTVAGVLEDDGSLDRWACFTLASLWLIAGNIITAIHTRRRP